MDIFNICSEGDNFMKDTLRKENSNLKSLCDEVITTLIYSFYIKGYEDDTLRNLGLQYIDRLLANYTFNSLDEDIKKFLTEMTRDFYRALIDETTHKYFGES